jgi:hypothetical protein
MKSLIFFGTASSVMWSGGTLFKKNVWATENIAHENYRTLNFTKCVPFFDKQARTELREPSNKF